MVDFGTSTAPVRRVGVTAADGGRRSLAGLWRVLRLWHMRARQRRHLARLDERLLTDIGVDRLAASREARKPFWRA